MMESCTLICVAAVLASNLVPDPSPRAHTAVYAENAASPASSTADEVPRVVGQFSFAGGERERQALLAAIEEVIADMNFIARPIARRRLRESTAPTDELHVLISDAYIEIVRPGRPTVSAPRDGSEITWTSPDGDEFAVRHRLHPDGSVSQQFVGDGSRSRMRIEPSEDGERVVVRTVISADRLPRPLRFSMTYRRTAHGD